MTPKKVTPAGATGYNMSITQLFGYGPKWTITCGECGLTFTKRIPVVDNPGVQCSVCGAINVIPIQVNRND